MSSEGNLPANILSLLNQGEAVGNQAQGSILLQLLTRIVAALEGGGGGGAGTLYTTHDVTATTLDISADFPGVTSGTFILKPSPAAPISVTLPAIGGPWIIADGNGFCGPSDQITVTGAGGVTVLGSTDFYMVKPWQCWIFIKDGGASNYIGQGT